MPTSKKKKGFKKCEIPDSHYQNTSFAMHLLKLTTQQKFVQRKRAIHFKNYH